MFKYLKLLSSWRDVSLVKPYLNPQLMLWVSERAILSFAKSGGKHTVTTFDSIIKILVIQGQRRTFCHSGI